MRHRAATRVLRVIEEWELVLIRAAALCLLLLGIVKLVVYEFQHLFGK